MTDQEPRKYKYTIDQLEEAYRIQCSGWGLSIAMKKAGFHYTLINNKGAVNHPLMREMQRIQEMRRRKKIRAYAAT